MCSVNYEKTVLVVLSGGQDSVTALYIAKSKYSKVEAVCFLYNQTNSVELEYAKRICEATNVKLKKIDITSSLSFIDSDLIGDNYKGKTIKDSFVPNRNMLMLTLAHGYAQIIKADYIYTGLATGVKPMSVEVGGRSIDLQEAPKDIHPDTTQSFTDYLSLALVEGSGCEIGIVNPLMRYNKKETYKKAEELGVLGIIVEDTLSCYNGDETMNDWGRGCNNCPPCNDRREGYKEYLKDLE